MTNKEAYDYLLNNVYTEEQIAANGGRSAVINKIKKFERKQRVGIFFKNIYDLIILFISKLWLVTKFLIIVFTIMYFVNKLH